MKSYLITSAKLLVHCLILLMLAACSSNPNEVAVSESSASVINASESPETATQSEATSKDTKLATKIIRNATIKMQVENFRESLAAIENTVKINQAYITTSNETHDDNQLVNTLTIRVPAAHLDVLLTQLIRHGNYLDFKNISSENVSAEFVDITARLKSKKIVEERYLTFLKNAKDVKEMLEIENEIRKIREEIEATQARINYLNDQTTYSTINLEVYQPTTVTVPTGNSFFIRIVNAVTTGWEMLLSLFIGLLYIWPLLLLIPVVVYSSRWFFQKYPPVR